MNNRQNFYRGFTRIDKLLNTSAKKHNFEQVFYQHQAIHYWDKAASGFLEEAANSTKAVDFCKGVLTVACLSREVAAKLKLLAQRIIAILNELLGRRVVFALSLEI